MPRGQPRVGARYVSLTEQSQQLLVRVAAVAVTQLFEKLKSRLSVLVDEGPDPIDLRPVVSVQGTRIVQVSTNGRDASKLASRYEPGSVAREAVSLSNMFVIVDAARCKAPRTGHRLFGIHVGIVTA